MKKTVLGLALIGTMSLSNAQTTSQASHQNDLLDAIHRDFPELVIKEQTVLPITYKSDGDGLVSLKENLGANRSDKDQQGYHVFIQGEKRVVSANYSKDFQLLWAIVKRKNIAPSAIVRNALYTEYPGWSISKNSYRLLRNENGQMKEMYKHVLTKDKQRITVKTDGHGKILDTSVKKDKLAMKQ